MIGRLRFIRDDINLPIIKYHRLCLGFAAVLVTLSLLLVGARGLNFGIDFLGGTLLEIETDESVEIGGLRDRLGGLGLGDVTLQDFGGAGVFLIRIQRQDGDDTAQQLALESVQNALGSTVIEYRRVETVGPTVGEELKSAAIWAIISAVFAILLYIWFRFEWQFSLAAILALSHDIITTLGLFAFLQIDFNLASVAAVLTIAGYSINDTVVIFDRVRENMRKYKRLELAELLNNAINQTLSRTLITSLSTMLALVALAVFGGAIIRDFAIAMIWGVAIGSFSSVGLAVPLLLIMRPHRGAFDKSDAAEATGTNEVAGAALVENTVSAKKSPPAKKAARVKKSGRKKSKK